MKAGYCSRVMSGSGRSLKNCFNAPATLLTSWKKCSGVRKSTRDESVIDVQLLRFMDSINIIANDMSYHDQTWL